MNIYIFSYKLPINAPKLNENQLKKKTKTNVFMIRLNLSKIIAEFLLNKFTEFLA